ncbi:MAG: FISUMP domain-containing protein [Patescibacteria group bacterium]|nr:FISUMP domain-containing protein [Patescibacteria group bacterium]
MIFFCKQQRAFTLVEVLLIVAVFLIILAGAFTVLNSRVFEDDIDAKAREVADIVSRAQNYSRSGYMGDVWGIKVLSQSDDCSSDGDCLILFKGNFYDDRDSAFDRQLNFGERNSGVYLADNQEREFYFTFGSGWLSSGEEEDIALESNFGLKKSVRVLPSGLAYVFTCGQSKAYDSQGQAYNTVEIADNCWLAENLNSGQMLESAISNPSDNDILEKWCYGNSEANCDIYGGLYSWDELMAYGTGEGARGICPAGWHLPTSAQWAALAGLYALPGNELAIGGQSGFNLLLAGQRNTSGGGAFADNGSKAFFWTSSQYDGSQAVYYYNENDANFNSANLDKSYGLSVRCLKDY